MSYSRSQVWVAYVSYTYKEIVRIERADWKDFIITTGVVSGEYYINTNDAWIYFQSEGKMESNCSTNENGLDIESIFICYELALQKFHNLLVNFRWLQGASMT